jgi:hypothetical protein
MNFNLMNFSFSNRIGLFSATLIFSAPLSQAAAIAAPAWEGDVNTTSALYNFPTDNRTSDPDEFSNPYGTPVLLVEDVTPPGSGWQNPDPNVPNQSIREDGEGGAWDLGPSGQMTFGVPIGNSLGLSPMDLEIHVSFVWQELFGPESEPGFSLTSGNPTFETIDRFTVVNETIGDWEATVWQATFENFSEEELTLVFEGDSNGSVLEQVSIQTRVVPEPSALVLIFAGLGAFVFRRNRH